MKKITVFIDDKCAGVEAEGCAWVDYLSALSILATFARNEIHKPAKFIDAKILLATSRQFASEYAKEANQHAN